jgi:uncharacterized membrane protein YedE/YeeE
MPPATLLPTVSSGYWPFWLGGALLGGICLVHWTIERRILGASGRYHAIVDRATDRDAAVTDEADDRSAAELEAALLAATADAMGEAIPDEGTPRVDARDLPRTFVVPWTAHASFFVGIAAGAALVALGYGRFSITETMGATFDRIIGTGAHAIPILFLGGIMVGFGTRMAGGCTSGHGLGGTSRLQPGALLNTACFFAAAVAMSLAMEGLAGG